VPTDCIQSSQNLRDRLREVNYIGDSNGLLQRKPVVNHASRQGGFNCLGGADPDDATLKAGSPDRESEGPANQSDTGNGECIH
jgi:hypothetical protein